MLPLPVGFISLEIVTMYFGESRGHLHFIPYKNPQENILRLNVYEMFSDYSGWFVKYQVELDTLRAEVIDVVRGEEEDTFLVLKSPEKMTTYNVHDKSFKHIFSFTGCSYKGISKCHRYTETLSSFIIRVFRCMYALIFI
ncbi:hypothetical protein HanRHA438_Chr16g0779411 [Helianthus annuus]|nr:hypothetical protein HanRHA438_Chr16g0779411 [Helianthus annuus]